MTWCRCFPTIALLIASTLAVLPVGCATWTSGNDSKLSDVADRVTARKGPPRSQTSKLQPVRASRSAIVLAVDFVTIGGAQGLADQAAAESDAALWQWVDEAMIAPDIRRRLLSNGLRCGRVIREERFRKELDERRVGTDDALGTFMSEAHVASQLAHDAERIPMRLGKRHEVLPRQPLSGSHVTLIRDGDQTIGRTLSDPQFLFAVTPVALTGPGQVALKLRPQVQHGAMKQTFVSSETAIRIDTRRETWSLDQLDLDVTLSEGDTLVIAGGTPPLGLGRQMLTANSSLHGDEQVVLLIKLEVVPSAADRRLP